MGDSRTVSSRPVLMLPQRRPSGSTSVGISSMASHAPALRALALRARLAFDDGTARRVAQPLRALHRRVATPPAATSIALGILERRLGEVARARTLLTSALPEPICMRGSRSAYFRLFTDGTVPCGERR